MSDKISCRLESDVSQALRELVQSNPGESISSVVNAALRVWLGTKNTPTSEPDVWAAIAAIQARLDALETARPATTPTSAPTQRKPPSRPAQTPLRATADGLLTDADVAARLGRNKNGFQNSVRAAGLTDGDEYQGFRIVGKVADPQLGGPPRRMWEMITDGPA